MAASLVKGQGKGEVSVFPSSHCFRRRWWGWVAVVALLSSQTVFGFTLERSVGIWTAADADPEHLEGLGTQELRWGKPVGEEKSGFRFDGAGSQTFAPGEPFLLGTFTHHNRLTSHEPGASQAKLEITLYFSDPTALPPLILACTFQIEETENTETLGGCPLWQGSSTPCDDRVRWTDIPDRKLEIGGKIYALQIIGFMDRYPGGIPVGQFITREERDNVAYLVGRLLVEEKAVAPRLESVQGVWRGLDADPMYVEGLGTQELRWGDPAGEEKSGFRFDGAGPQTFAIGEPFLLGTFAHHNRLIHWETGPSQATLDITLRFSDPPISPTIAYTFRIEETENTESLRGCPRWQASPTPCDDRVWWTDIPDQKFELEGKLYTLQIVGFVDHYPGGEPVEQFVTQEERDNVAYLVGRLLVGAPTLRLKIRTNTDFASVGDTVIYTLTVANVGQGTLHNVIVVDEKLGIYQAVGTLAPGGEYSLRATYRVTEADMGGPLETVARAFSDETAVPATASHTVNVAYTAGLSITIRANKQSAAVEDLITYTIMVTNTGNVRLRDVTVNAPKLRLQGAPLGSLAPNQSGTMTVTYQVTEADMHSPLAVQATAMATDPRGRPVGPVSADLSLPTHKRGFSLSESVPLSSTGAMPLP